MKTIRYYTNIAPHYRKKLWELFLADKDLKFDIFFGEPSEHNKIKEIDFSELIFINNKGRLHKVKNVRIFNVLIYQTKVIPDSLFSKPDFALILGQAYIISNWIAALIYKLKKVKVIIWGHSLYGKEFFIKKQFYTLFAKIADHYISYNHRGKDLLIKSGIDENRIRVIYNSLDYDFSREFRNRIGKYVNLSELKVFNDPSLKLLIFIGRLTKEKKIDILIEAVKLLNKNETRYNLIIIGDGSEKENLQKTADEGIKKGYIYFYGAIYDENKIAELISISDLCVSPGNVGLTAVHSFSYGTPVCTHDNFSNQGPEYEIIEEGKTGFFFKENDINDLTRKIENWFRENNDREAVRQSCYKLIDEKYNPYGQVKVLKEIILKYCESSPN